MSLENNVLAGVLVNICKRSDNIPLIIYGHWLESNGAVPVELPNEDSKHLPSTEGSTTT